MEESYALTNNTRRTHAVGKRRRGGLVDDSQHLSNSNETQAAMAKEPGEEGARAKEGRSQRKEQDMTPERTAVSNRISFPVF